MEVDVLGIDLAKQVFQLHGASRSGLVVHRSKVSRQGLLTAVRNLKPRLVVMEACSSAHYWARRLQAMGIEAKLISPQYVAPFVKTNKNDRNDAEAIVEAASRPTMRFVPVKTVEQQDMTALHRIRQLLVQQATAVINQVRGILGERGIVIAKSPAAFYRAMPDVLASDDAELTQFCRGLLVSLLEHLRSIEERITEADGKIKGFMRSSALCQKISAIDGVGAVTATAIVAAVGDASKFRNGRHLAAWLGLVPRQHSSGGKSRLSGISKRGDVYLRTLLIHGARSVLRFVADKTDAQSKWLRELIGRRGFSRAAVALANKNARVIQALLSSDRDYVRPGAA
ncbi:IS110 family transposase [Azohydromonas australica]|uniref:IS110 family transposase n=1 Tax=Azohydromonas australica TaxID=364039 RepID=UPI00041A6B17|nr:IS110 family transposase [Azohydromonas australica]